MIFLIRWEFFRVDQTMNGIFQLFNILTVFLDPLHVSFESCVTSDGSHDSRFQDHRTLLEEWKSS